MLVLSLLLVETATSRDAMPVDNSWDAVTPMIVGKDEFGVAIVDGQIYAVGGMTGPLATPLADNEVYDPIRDEWQELPSLPEARRAVRAIAVGQSVYVVGGTRADNTVVTTVDIFDTVQETWSAGPPLPSSAQSLGLAAIGEMIYAFGGSTTMANSAKACMRSIRGRWPGQAARRCRLRAATSALPPWTAPSTSSAEVQSMVHRLRSSDTIQPRTRGRPSVPCPNR